MKSLLGQVRVDMSDFYETTSLLALVNEEMQRQEQLWGIQSHPLTSRSEEDSAALREDYRATADLLKECNDEDAKTGRQSWAGILGEEFYEAIAEDNTPAAITELIQVAASALSAIKSLKRHGIHGAERD